MTLQILQDAASVGHERYRKQMRLSVNQVIEKVVNRGQGWGGPRFSYTWLQVLFDDRADTMPLTSCGDVEERFHLDIDCGSGTYYVGDRRRSRFFNSAADEHENFGLDHFLPARHDDHGYRSMCDNALDYVIEYGLLPGQRLLIASHFSGGTDYWGEYDSDFDTSIIYIEPMTLREDLLAEVITEEEWPMKFVLRPEPTMSITSVQPVAAWTV